MNLRSRQDQIDLLKMFLISDEENEETDASSKEVEFLSVTATAISTREGQKIMMTVTRTRNRSIPFLWD